MGSYTVYSHEENKDKVKSALLSILIWAAVLLFIYLYKLRPEVEADPEIVTTMLVNFGDNRDGIGEKEPAEQLGNPSEITVDMTSESEEMHTSETKTIVKPIYEPKKRKEKEKFITGNNTKISVPKKGEIKKTVKKAASSAGNSKNTKKTSATTFSSKVVNRDSKGNVAIGNLIKGRGTKARSQGSGEGIGNAGDPLGGSGNGASKVGVDRKLISFIPGTMGRGGAQPSHSCTASGSIIISYTVDKAGNVVSARRSGGISDPCILSTSIAWVKKYVKAEKANTSSTGTYKITF